ncbi:MULTISPECIES: hypothetical protein [Bacillus cereus group]|uniref:Uncharacterized protein n=1 Tax=Bacillus thuringiensis TaxID=1428 RepID=A0A9X7FY42_BACTU|nr:MULTISPECIES: hypothetical protein [Bacillus cereus group]PFT50844.1 hypothetical protein COK72_02220 [Bacillus thuringiensis]PFY22881.1 hypothetical protein COL44_18540 [Bacillus toyonensis]
MSKYSLTKRPAVEGFKVTIVADSNDADYITTINTYTKSEFEDGIIDELIDLQENHSGHYELEKFHYDHLQIPYGDMDICHTLSSIDVEYTDAEGNVWDVVF